MSPILAYLQSRESHLIRKKGRELVVMAAAICVGIVAVSTVIMPGRFFHSSSCSGCPSGLFGKSLFKRVRNLSEFYSVNVTHNTSSAEDIVTNESAQQRPGHHPVQNVRVFYNVYASAGKASVAEGIAKEQMAQLRPEHQVFVRSIGVRVNVQNSTLLAHDKTGGELGTLELLWQYCRNNTKDTVVYIHNKGSFHPSPDNTKMRRFLTRGALSRECANMPPYCNVCSSRMSPFPHPHTSGNMWAARCSYVAKLWKPMNFDTKMTGIWAGVGTIDSCVGWGRYAAEHWVHSHPSVRPCDLSIDDRYVWDYAFVPPADFEINLQPFPRYHPKKYVMKDHPCKREQNIHESLNIRVKEYQSLYGQTPAASWWGWKFYNDSERV
eukprot:CAMPEP_0174951002 /NCGR_PEP_ID=MMETSP1355-20121228/94619_1 /TAXON_ID=464990 /ORGANISM="Hemiselmis tepida, Strain CCMP443" /LENGTH=379 /DNA_ID=CAMNT_0016198641 /DNA_START=231 /DNA_END=1370 /DNA_ORIENTATION=-